jgi:hypothetical protein
MYFKEQSADFRTSLRGSFLAANLTLPFCRPSAFLLPFKGRKKGEIKEQFLGSETAGE